MGDSLCDQDVIQLHINGSVTTIPEMSRFPATTVRPARPPNDKYRRASEAVLTQAAQPLWTRDPRRARASMGCVTATTAFREIPGINMTLSPDDPSIRTIKQHYYPEGGWGWVVTACVALAHFVTAGLSPAVGLLVVDIVRGFNPDDGVVAAGK